MCCSTPEATRSACTSTQPMTVSAEWVRLRLRPDLAAFDDASSSPVCSAIVRPDWSSAPWLSLGDTPAQQLALYALNKACSADIPERGEFYTVEEYLAQRVNSETFDPRGVVLAVEREHWVGMSTTSLQREEVGFARRAGMRWLRTFHHPSNASAIAMNRRLGYVDDRQPWSTP